jgi:hypothetical protein
MRIHHATPPGSRHSSGAFSNPKWRYFIMSKFLSILSLVLAAGGLLPGTLQAEVTFAADNLNMSGNRITGLNMAPSPANNDAVNVAYIKALEALLEHFTRDGNQIYITGGNLHVRSGEGSTDAEPNGLGNIIIGYDEERFDGDSSCSLGQYDNETNCTGNNGTWALSHKTGSHNLVVGKYHNYSRYGGLVVGDINTISRSYSAVSGGHSNTTSGNYSAVSGGFNRSVSGFYDWRAGDLFEDN